MAYGLRITPEVGKPFVMDEASRYLSNLGYIQFIGSPKSVNFSRAVPSGATPLVIPRQMGTLVTGVNYATPYVVQGISISGNTLTWTGGNAQLSSGSTLVIGDANVFSVSGSESQGGYGVRFTGGSNFMEINDSSLLGYTSYVGTVDIVNNWSIPTDVINRGDYVVFARWSNTSTPLYLDRASNIIRVYSGFSNVNGSVNSGTVTGVQIVIISTGSVPEAPSGGYGLLIRNASGVVTFSSKFPPVAYTGTYFPIPAEADYGDGTGDADNYVTAVGGSASLPMVPLCCLGTARGDYSRSNTTYTFRPMLMCGMKMSGNSVSIARARGGYGDSPVYIAPKRAICGFNLPAIDAARYF